MMNRRVLILGAFFFVLVARAFADGPPLKIEEKATAPTKVLVLSDFSGPGAQRARATRRAAELFANEIRERGEQLELIVSDYRGSSARGRDLFYSEFLKGRIDIVYVDSSETASAISEAANESRALLIYAGRNASLTSANPFSFSTGPNPKDVCRRFARLWHDQGYTRIAVFKRGAEADELCLEGALQVDPDIIHLDYHLDQTVETQAEVLVNKRPHAIAAFTYSTELEELLVALKKFKYEGMIGANETAFTPRILERFKADRSRLYFARHPEVSGRLADKLNPKEIENAEKSPSIPPLKNVDLFWSSLVYTHLNQAQKAVLACTSLGINCRVKILERSPSESSSGFVKWEDRVAVFDYSFESLAEAGQKS